MKHNALSKPLVFLPNLILIMGLGACRSNPNKAEAIQTQLDQPAAVSSGQNVGLKSGEMVVLSKVQISERLRDLQNAVYSLEDRVYGTRKLGSLGLYGDLKSCMRRNASHQYGGSGTLVWTEPLDRVTDKEDDLKLGLDEKKDLVGVSEEYLKDRLQRFQGYKMILQKRSDEFEEKIEQCKADLATKTQDTSQSSKVMVSEAPKVTQDKAAINTYMCSYVRPGASLRTLMMNAFAHGWLSLSDFSLDQNLLGGSAKDVKGETKTNAFLFSGWKLAFDSAPITVGQLLDEGKDAKLVAWVYDHKAEVSRAAACLPQPEGVWNH